ncbi:hypothetical protein [Sphingopyxis sp. BSNA05]|uniref:hypothetical protein n=1 Tax=Sphingopyxis sp. BSNA05 TaxID=1236614 RepID=UPI001566CC5E|nr:hypothetical protein [Sphingopyxis sp. BSNA05]
MIDILLLVPPGLLCAIPTMFWWRNNWLVLEITISHFQTIDNAPCRGDNEKGAGSFLPAPLVDFSVD